MDVGNPSATNVAWYGSFAPAAIWGPFSWIGMGGPSELALSLNLNDGKCHQEMAAEANHLLESVQEKKITGPCRPPGLFRIDTERAGFGLLVQWVNVF